MKKLLLFQSALVLSGMVFGLIAYAAISDEQLFSLQQYLTTQIQNLVGIGSVGEATGRIFRSNLLDMIRLYLAGSCLLGLPLLILFLFLKGFTFGFVSCFLFQHSVLLLLSRFLYLPLFVLATAIGIRFSYLILQNRLSSPARQLLEYTVTFGVLLVLTLLCSYVDGLSCHYFLQNLVLTK